MLTRNQTKLLVSGGYLALSTGLIITNYVRVTIWKRRTNKEVAELEALFQLPSYERA